MQAGIARIAAILADPAREAMLCALADGRIRPAGELAEIAGVTPQSASGHLRKLVEGGILSVWQQGRFRYFRLADETVAAVLEALAVIAHAPPGRVPRTAAHAAFAAARCCYDHLAGRLGVGLAEALREAGYVAIGTETAVLTEAGRGWAEAQDLFSSGMVTGTRELRLCLDWTERRFHLAGALPSALLRHLTAEGHIVRGAGRALQLTPSGERWFRALTVAL